MLVGVQSVSESVSRGKELNSLSVFTVFVVLVAVTMTFGALVAVFLIRSQSEQFWGHIRIPLTLWITTAILIASSATFEAARHQLTQNNQRNFFHLTAWTTGLGTCFLVGQIVAWFQVLRSGVKLAGNPHSWFIFLFTGLHALHILVGLAGFIYLLVRTKEPASGPRYQMSTRAVASGTAVFWHYLDFLWIVLFGLLVFWRR